MTILIPNEDLKFVKVKVASIREDAVFDMILNGHMDRKSFAKWVEGTRDEWFAIGEHSAKTQVNSNG